MQLQRDRKAVRDAITQYGWGSEQVDEAQEKLLRDRLIRRGLVSEFRSARSVTTRAMEARRLAATSLFQRGDSLASIARQRGVSSEAPP